MAVVVEYEDKDGRMNDTHVCFVHLVVHTEMRVVEARGNVAVKARSGELTFSRGLAG